MTKEWKDIKGYEGSYRISNTGEIESIKRKGRKKNKFLNPWTNAYGYKAIKLLKNGNTQYALVHRLVLLTFKPVSEIDLTKDITGHKYEVNHIDCNKKNNRLENLEWCTSKENMAHNIKINGRSSSAKLNKFQVQRVRLMKEITPKLTQGVIAKMFGVDQSTMSHILNNKYWKNA